MKRFNDSKVPLMVLAFVIAIALAGESARADVTFGEPVNLKSVIPVLNPADVEFPNCFSYDGLEMYIISLRPGGQGDADLWVLRRASIDEDWGPPENLGPMVNSPKEDSFSSISDDGLTLYFASNRSGAYGSFDIYMTTRVTKNHPWGPAVNLGPNINSSAADGEPWISPDGLELYFASYRSGGYGQADIYVARRATPSDPWGEPANLGPVVNSAYEEHFLSLSPDGLVLLFSDRTAPYRPGGYGNSDMWMARRAILSDPWQSPVNLGPQVNGSAIEIYPRISPDGSTLYFMRKNQDGTRDNWQAPIIPNVDFDDDGDVDCTEICIMTEFWGTSDSLCDIAPPPFGDGVVDVQDLVLLAENLTTTVDPNFPVDSNSVTSVAARLMFGTPTNVGMPLNTSANDGTYSFSGDGLELYFASDRQRVYPDYDLYVMIRASTNEEWSDPANLGPTINSSSYDSFPCISPDGLELFLISERPGGFGGVDIWVTTRPTKGDAWGPPANLGPAVNTSQWDQSPAISSDGLTLMFASTNRPGGYGNDDLWLTTRATIHDAWASPVNLGSAINTPYEESWACLSPDGRALFFSSDRPGGFGNIDLWMAARTTTDGKWSTPINLGSSVNTSANEGATTVSLDGSILYFASDRAGGLGGWDQWRAPIIPNVDFDDDGDVDCTEICIMTEFWGTSDSLCDIAPPPFGDGIVDVQDLIVLAGHLFEETPPIE